MLAKSANQLFKEYRKEGGTLPFSEWIAREKEKALSADGVGESAPAVFMMNVPVTDTLNRTIEEMRRQGGLKDEAKGGTTLGISNTVLLISGGALLAATAYFLIKKHSK